MENKGHSEPEFTSLKSEEALKPVPPRFLAEHLMRQNTLWNVVTNSTRNHDSEAIYRAETELREYAEVEFKVIVFLKELVYHVFNFLPLLIWFEGIYGTTNRRFFPRNRLIDIIFFVQWFNICSLLAINLLYFLDPPPYVSLYEILLIDLMWFGRNIVVATKYAYTSRRELRDMKKAVLEEDVHSNRQVLTGWLFFSPELASRELTLASLRQGVDLRKIPIVLNKLTVHNFRVLFDLALADRENHPDDSYLEPIVVKDDFVEQVPASLLAKQLILSSNVVGFSVYPLYFFRFLGLLEVFLPVMIRGIQGQPPFGGWEWQAYVIFGLSFLFIMFTMVSNWMFMYAGMVDFGRRKYIHDQMLSLFQEGYIPPSVVLQRQKQEKAERKQQFFAAHRRGSSSRSLDESPLKTPSEITVVDIPITTASASGSLRAIQTPDGRVDLKDASATNDADDVSPFKVMIEMQKTSSTISLTPPVETGSSSGFKSVFQREKTKFLQRNLEEVDGTTTQALVMDYSVPGNVLAWWKLRETLTDFGIVYNKRIEIYIGSFLLIALALLVFVVVEALVGTRFEIDVVISLCIFFIVCFSVLFSFLVTLGGSLNFLRKAHAVEIMKKKAILEYILGISAKKISAKCRDDLMLSIEFLQSVYHLVVTDNELHTTRILGFDAGAQLGRWLLVVGLAGLGAALKQYF